MAFADKEKEREYKRQYYLANKEKLRPFRNAANSRWRKKNKIKVNGYAANSRKKNPTKGRDYYRENNEVLRAKCNLKTEKLTESYMIKHLKKLGYDLSHIKKYPELIETYRIIIKTKRLCKRSLTSAT